MAPAPPLTMHPTLRKPAKLATRIRVLVVEDVRTVAVKVQSVLLQSGMDVELAETGAEAWAQKESFHPDIALVDLGLPDVEGCLAKVHDIYETDADLKANHCIGLFHAFVYFCLTDAKDKRLKPFTQWVKGNHLAAMRATDAHALIDIFERVHTAKARTVFVSMQFGPETDFVFDTITKAVDAINKECRPKIKVRPLRIDKHNTGHSYTITDAILTAIEESGLLIADLSQGNKNVYHEVGYMMGLNRGKGQAQANFILVARDRPEDKLEMKMGFNLKGISQIRFKESIDLEKKFLRPRTLIKPGMVLTEERH